MSYDYDPDAEREASKEIPDCVGCREWQAKYEAEHKRYMEVCKRLEAVGEKTDRIKNRRGGSFSIRYDTQLATTKPESPYLENGIPQL
jgi:hypothetical protein